MTRVAAPHWADQPRTTRDNIADSDFQAIQEHREEMLAAVHQAVEKYFNARGRFGPGDFPERALLTGEYYLGEESYYGDPSAALRVRIECRCLRHPWLPGSNEKDDYVGLEVLLRWQPGRKSFKWEASDLFSL